MTLINQKQLCRELGVSAGTVQALRLCGAITPVISEKRIIRYDLDQVRQQLAERAKNRKGLAV